MSPSSPSFPKAEDPDSDDYDYDSEVPEEEIDALLEAGLPEEMKGPRRRRKDTQAAEGVEAGEENDTPYDERQKMVLVGKEGRGIVRKRMMRQGSEGGSETLITKWQSNGDMRLEQWEKASNQYQKNLINIYSIVFNYPNMTMLHFLFCFIIIAIMLLYVALTLCLWQRKAATILKCCLKVGCR